MDVTAAAEVLTNMGLVAGIVEALKRAVGPSFNAERFGPLLALTVGVAIAEAGVYLNWYEAGYDVGALQGLIAGLSASGLQRTIVSGRG